MKKFLLISLMCFGLHSPLFSAEDLFRSIQKTQNVKILKVLTADTIILDNKERVKLIGIESLGLPPKVYVELDEKGIPIETTQIDPTTPLESQALSAARDLMEGRDVRLEFDSEFRNNKGEKNAYVWLSENKMANVELLRQGLVNMKFRLPNVKYEPLFKEAYAEAKKEQRGFLGN